MMEKFRILGTLLLLWIALFQVDKIDATALSNFNLETNWDTYLCANENPIVDEKTVILTATGLTSSNLPCVALRKNLKISGEYQLSSQLINVGPPTGERNFGVVFNAEDEKNYDFAYLSYDVHDKCIKVQPGYVEKGVITKLKKKLGCIDRQPKKWNALKLIVKEECNHCNNVEAFVDGRDVGSFEAHFVTRGFGGVLAENGFTNIAEFRKFDIAPIIPDLELLPPSRRYQLVFRQTLPYLYKRNEWRKNPTDPSSDNYSILDQLEQFRNGDGRFYFRMTWPDDATVYEWSQTSNPVSEKLAGYQPISVPYTGKNWKGIEPSTYALMDGSISSVNWWYALGSYQLWRGGIPSYAKTDNDNEYPKQGVELDVRTG